MEIDYVNAGYLHRELSNDIISLYYKVYNALGFGFLEQVYQNALYYELNKNGYKVDAQKDIKVYYDHKCVGLYRADIIVEDAIILELKAVESLTEAHECQLVNYLRATEFEVGLLLNFGRKPEIRRKVFTNDKKNL